MPKSTLKFVVLAILIIASTTSFSQTYTISPNDSLTTSTTLEDLKVMTIYQQHSASDTLLLSWQKVSVTAPATWDLSLCDYENCYTNLPDTGTMTPVIPGNDGLLSLHAIAHVTTGTAIVRYAVWSPLNAIHKDTLTWVINCYPTSIDNVQQTVPEIRVKRDMLHIENLPEGQSFIIISDQTGVIHGKFSISAHSNTISHNNLANGLYYAIICTPTAAYRQQLLLLQ